MTGGSGSNHMECDLVKMSTAWAIKSRCSVCIFMDTYLIYLYTGGIFLCLRTFIKDLFMVNGMKR